MLPIQGYYGIVQSLPSMQSMKGGGNSTLSSGSKDIIDTSSKSTEACKSHKEAERRRRQRINAHLSTLRSLLPNTIKTDKASLLAEVVNHVKELRKQATAATRKDDNVSSEPAGSLSFPSESDEATLSYCHKEDTTLMKATLCCEDRPGLNRDIVEAIRSVRVKPVRAEMMTIGGRTKSVVVMQWADGECEGDEQIGALKRALKAVVENRGLVYGLGNKRARICSSIGDVKNEFINCRLN